MTARAMAIDPARLAYVWLAYSLALGVFAAVGGFVIGGQLWLLSIAQLPGLIAAWAVITGASWARGALVMAAVINLPTVLGVFVGGFTLWWLSERDWTLWLPHGE